jgi:hypothetical protein
MIALAYFLAYLTFSISTASIGQSIRLLWIWFLEKFFKFKDVNYFGSTQMIWVMVSSIIGFHLSLLPFRWLDKEYNLYTLGIIYFLMFLLITTPTERSVPNKPKSQRLGMLIGLVISIASTIIS